MKTKSKKSDTAAAPATALPALTPADLSARIKAISVEFPAFPIG